MEELKHSLLLATLELETTLVSANEEITRRDFELVNLKDVLSRIMKERDEAQGRCQKLILEKFMLLQQLQQPQLQPQHKQQQRQQQETASLSGVSSSEDNDTKSADDSNRSIISSPSLDSVIIPEDDHQALKLAANRPLPEKGKLLQAVKDAGPLLQNLLLAGPLPQWQHPPPQLTSIDIPPVSISSPLLIKQDSFNNLNIGCLSKKRGTPENYEGSVYSCPNNKYQKVVCSSLNKTNCSP